MGPTEPEFERRRFRMEFSAWLCFVLGTGLFWHWLERELDLERTEDVAIGLLVVAAVLAGLAVVLMVLALRPYQRIGEPPASAPPDDDSMQEFEDNLLADTE